MHDSANLLFVFNKKTSASKQRAEALIMQTALNDDGIHVGKKAGKQLLEHTASNNVMG